LKGEHERAEEYLDGFARLLRSVLEHSVRDRISLGRGDRLPQRLREAGTIAAGADFTWSITADPRRCSNEEPQIPSLLVQPFVENAIWHGAGAEAGAEAA
jgi:hypothetical protein